MKHFAEIKRLALELKKLVLDSDDNIGHVTVERKGEINVFVVGSEKDMIPHPRKVVSHPSSSFPAELIHESDGVIVKGFLELNDPLYLEHKKDVLRQKKNRILEELAEIETLEMES